jgi:hypothetical protein
MQSCSHAKALGYTEMSGAASLFERSGNCSNRDRRQGAGAAPFSSGAKQQQADISISIRARARARSQLHQLGHGLVLARADTGDDM